MDIKMRTLFSTLLFVWLCSWRRSSAQSPIRISAYPYPDPPGYGMRIEPRSSDERPKRNATFVVPQSETTVEGSKHPHGGTTAPPEGEDFSSYEERPKGEEEDEMFDNMSSVNRMGLAAGMTRRKVPLQPQVPRRRFSGRSSTEASTTLRSFGGIPGGIPDIAPPSPPQQGGLVGPPAIPGLGSARPPAPPVLPPAPPKPALVGQNFGPPAIPDPIKSPSPPPGADEAQVTEIKCMETSTTSSFMAVLSLPAGYNAIPVFEDRPSVDPTINTVCRMIPTDIDNNMFQLIVADLERCGVRKCRQPNGETWLCLTLRFPLVGGLKLPEDELILIRCRPQDKTATDTHVLRVATANNQQSSPSVFDGGQQDFRCEIGLFRKLPGTDIFAARVTGEVELDLGEEVQLRSIVQAGDGWQYSLLTTVIIQKVNAPKQRSILNAADLVFADGCRNPSYRVIARNHPKRDPRNPLINNFTFRVFMFQDMEVDEDLMITANVIGCVDAQDCAPTQCSGDDEDRLGYGKRKRRAVGHYSFTTIISASDILSSSTPPYPPPSSLAPYSTDPTPSYSHTDSHTHKFNENTTTSWERNLRLKIRVPDSDISQKPVEAHECRLYLFITLGVAAVFCIASIVFVIVTLFRSRSSSKMYHAPITVSRVHNQPSPPSLVASSASSSSASTCSSSILSSEESLSSGSNKSSPLRDFVVPATVRQRKRDVNAELMNVFENDRLFPYGTYCPGMLNYYGYMVVPRKTPADASSEKRSLRAIKRDQKKHRIDRHDQKQIQHQHPCQCSENVQQSSQEDSIASENQNHKSVIHISSSSSNPTFSGLSQYPKPMPRMTKGGEDENIYSEISLDSNPTMV